MEDRVRTKVKGFLHTKGTKIVNGEDQEIVLCGYGCGNWTNPEGFMIGAPTDIQLVGDIFSPKLITPRRFDRRRSMDQVIKELCGSEYAKEFWPKWHRNHLAEADIKVMSELGLNSVRLPLNAMAFLEEEPGIHFIEDSFQMLEEVLDWCEKYKIYAIIDLHAAPGGQSATACDGGLDNLPHLFIDEENWERALLLWEEIAKRYHDRWIVGGYDLLNEPVSLPNHHYCVPKLAKFYDEAIARIRKYDKKHMFTLEGSCFSRSNQIFDHMYDPECHNWCIHIHMYDPSPEKKELYPYLLKGLEYQVPVWIGEGNAAPGNNAVFYGIAADYGIGFCLWCWKTAIEEQSLCNSVGYHLPKEWELIRKYCAGGPKPSYTKSREIFDELLENIRYENCIHNKEHIRISRKSPELDLAAVGYDNLPGDGFSFCGNWNYGNLLNYRLEDRTKLVWTPGMEEPRPGFDMYEDENIQKPMNPLECLMLELAQEEFAVYTINEVKEQCELSLTADSPDGAEITVIVEGDELGRITLGTELKQSELKVRIPAAPQVKITLKASNGVARVKTLHFHYTLS